MEIEILGSGGSLTTPKIFCNCTSCNEARSNGETYSRLGPSVFIHGPNILIDTPEEISTQINRSSIPNINACFYSHWHPDHTAGRRIFCTGEDLINEPPKNKCTQIILTEKIASTFKNNMSIMGHFDFMEHQGVVKINIIKNDQEINIDGYDIQPIQLAQDYVFGYKICSASKKILVIMDELKDWKPPREILSTTFDLIYLPFGIFHYNPITDKKILPEDCFLLEEEATIDETLSIIENLDSKRFILSHIEEVDNITIDLAKSLEEYYSIKTGKQIDIAFDTMKVSV